MKYGFGVDVGGTTVKIGLFEQEGTLLESMEIPTHTENGGERILPEIADAIGAVLARRNISHSEVAGIGIGVPGPVAADGMVNRCVNLNWGVFNLHEALEKLTGLCVKAGNDANCAALGEHWMGGGMGCRSTIFVTLGTGIGGGVILDGKILNGAHGVGGEIGHITVNAPIRYPCTCGKVGCVEQYASANGVVRVTKQRLSETEESSVLRGREELTCKDVFDAAKGGDRFAEDTLELVFDYLGEALASACCVADPERIILGGGMSKAGDFLLERVERHFKKHMFHACQGTEFSLAVLGNDAGMYGAYRLLMTERSEGV